MLTHSKTVNGESGRRIQVLLFMQHAAAVSCIHPEKVQGMREPKNRSLSRDPTRELSTTILSMAAMPWRD